MHFIWHQNALHEYFQQVWYQFALHLVSKIAPTKHLPGSKLDLVLQEYCRVVQKYYQVPNLIWHCRSSLFQPELMLLVCSASAFINTSITVTVFSFFFIFCFISLDFVILFGFCSFVWCFIFQDYFLCNPSQPLQPFIAPLRGKSLWKARKETSSVRISFLVFKFSLQFFKNVYEKREKEHYQSEFLCWF